MVTRAASVTGACFGGYEREQKENPGSGTDRIRNLVVLGTMRGLLKYIYKLPI